MWKENVSKAEEETLDSWRKKYKLHAHQLPIMLPENTDRKHDKSHGYQLPEDASDTMKDNYRRVKESMAAAERIRESEYGYKG